MPSFLSKVFSRKKQDESKSPVLLEGKYEAVTAPSSSSGSPSPEDEHHDGFPGLSLFRTKSKPLQTRTTTSTNTKGPPPPALTLNLPDPEKQPVKDLGAVFDEGTDGEVSLDDATIGGKRLTPLETLLLVRACSKIIAERGLETLGVMHPHWHSASVTAQRKLISLFIKSLATASPGTTTAAFDSEMDYTRSVYDIAAVLRWGLRHLKLDGPSFGKISESSEDEWSWYTAFSTTERDGSYSANAYSQVLIPQIPPAHNELLGATLELTSSLAARAEYNGISGSKLSKFFGLWLLSTERADDAEDWPTFYARWERAGRILEHLFLARIREQAVDHKMPKRLRELVNNYPFAKMASPTDNGLLPRPRFSTRNYDALFVRINTELQFGAKKDKPRQHPSDIVETALRSEFSSENEDESKASVNAIWTEIRRAATGTTNSEVLPISTAKPLLSQVLADDTLRLFSLVPAEHVYLPASPTIAIASPQRGRSASVLDGDPKGKGKAEINGSASHTKAAAAPTQETESSTLGVDWSQFSSSGFGGPQIGSSLAATLLDNEVEVSKPPVKRRFSQRRASGSGRSSVDLSFNAPPLSPTTAPAVAPRTKVTTASVELTSVDEAFVDFYSDGFLDPVAANWPSFALCQLRPLPALKAGDKVVSWLVVQHMYSVAPPPEPTLVEEAPSQRPRASSPRPSRNSSGGAGGRMASTFSSARKRFTIFGGSSATDIRSTGIGAKNATPKIGELGEIVHEEEEKHESKERSPPADIKANGHHTSETVVAGAAALGIAAVAVVEEQKAETPAEAKSEAKDAVDPRETVTTENPEIKSNEESLPPAPESVVETGETPGPQLALATSEPEALQDPALRVTPAEEAQLIVQEVPPPTTEPAIAPIAEDPTADTELVSQDPVPVVEDESTVESTPVTERPEEPSPSVDSVTVDHSVVVGSAADEQAPMIEEIVPTVEPASAVPQAETASVKQIAAEPPIAEEAKEQPVVFEDTTPIVQELEAPVPAVGAEPVEDSGRPIEEPTALEDSPPVPQEADELALVAEEPVSADEPVPIVEAQESEEPAVVVEQSVTSVEEAGAVKLSPQPALIAEDGPIEEEAPTFAETEEVLATAGEEPAEIAKELVAIEGALAAPEPADVAEQPTSVDQVGVDDADVEEQAPAEQVIGEAEEVPLAVEESSSEAESTSIPDEPLESAPVIEEHIASTVDEPTFAEEQPSPVEEPAIAPTSLSNEAASFEEAAAELELSADADEMEHGLEVPAVEEMNGEA